MRHQRLRMFFGSWFADIHKIPFVKLPYGENPHQAAVYIPQPMCNAPANVPGRAAALSFNNLLDIETLHRIFDALGARSRPAVAIIKHAGPCGVAVADTLEVAYAKAYAADSRSAYGGVVGLNRTLDTATAQAIIRHYTVAVVCPAITDAAAAVLAQKPDIRVVVVPIGVPAAYDIRQAAGGVIIQRADIGRMAVLPRHCVTSRTPTPFELADLRVAMSVVRGCYSNAIVVVRDGVTLGIGAGQPNRIDALWIALERAKREGHDVRGAVLASDGFFFPDAVSMAHQAGLVALVQPGGSKRDHAVIASAEDCNVSLLFTQQRHFKH